MSLSFGTSVAVNNLIALKAFRTYLINYKQHEMPRGKRANWFVRWLERMAISLLTRSLWISSRQRFIIGFAKSIIEAQALKTVADLIVDPDAKKASVSLKDVEPAMFTMLYLVQNPYLLADVKTGTELFAIISQLELEFALIKHPRESVQHGTINPQETGK